MTEQDLTEQAEKLLAEMRPFAPSAAPGQNFLPPETRRDVPGEHGATPVWRAGEGPDTTLFVHGWDDSHRVWRQFAMHFLQTGRPILLMDLPAHGASKADWCNWKNAGASVADVIHVEDPIETIIAHSFGCRAAIEAATTGAHVEALVLIAPPLQSWTERQREKGTGEPVIEKARELYHQATGVEMDGQDFEASLKDYAGRILLIASEADESCPISGLRDLASRIPDAEFIETPDLSHRELALHPAILAEIRNFLGH